MNKLELSITDYGGGHIVYSLFTTCKEQRLIRQTDTIESMEHFCDGLGLNLKNIKKERRNYYEKN